MESFCYNVRSLRTVARQCRLNRRIPSCQIESVDVPRLFGRNVSVLLGSDYTEYCVTADQHSLLDKNDSPFESNGTEHTLQRHALTVRL